MLPWRRLSRRFGVYARGCDWPWIASSENSDSMRRTKPNWKRKRLETYAASSTDDADLKSSVRWALVTIDDLRQRLADANDIVVRFMEQKGVYLAGGEIEDEDEDESEVSE